MRLPHPLTTRQLRRQHDLNGSFRLNHHRPFFQVLTGFCGRACWSISLYLPRANHSHGSSYLHYLSTNKGQTTMNYTNDFYNQDTYNSHFQIDHISQQQNLIEAMDHLIIDPSNAPLDTPDLDDLFL